MTNNGWTDCRCKLCCARGRIKSSRSAADARLMCGTYARVSYGQQGSLWPTPGHSA